MDDNQPIDQQALNLSRAIALQESGGNPNKMGDNDTAAGLGQWSNQVNGKPQPLSQGEVPANFKSYAQKYGTDPNDFSQINQEKTLYAEVAYKKNVLGWSPAQIAASHNAGDAKAADGSWQQNIGTTTLNGKPIAYDTPKYVENVKKYYDQLSGQAGPQPNEFPSTKLNPLPDSSTQPQDSDSLRSEITNRGQGIASGLSQAGQGVSEMTQGNVGGGLLDIGGGLLHGAGEIGGGVGDITNKAIEAIPVVGGLVKGAEGLVGDAASAAANTDIGKKALGFVANEAQQHPKLAQAAGDALNIASAIPILKGVGVIGGLVKDAGSQALKGAAEKSFVSGIPDIMGNSAKATRFIEANPTIGQDMVDRRLVGDVKDGVFSSSDSAQKSWNTIQDMNKQVKTILSRPEFANISKDGKGIAQQAIDGFTDRNGNVIDGIPNSGMTPQELIANAKRLDPNNALLWDKFEAGQANLKEINDLRSSLDGKVKKVYLGKATLDSPEVATSKENGALLAQAMREAVQVGAPSTAVPFKEMATQFKIQKALELLNGKKIKAGGAARLAGHIAGIGAGGVAGSVVGGTTGAVIGGMIGDKAAGTVAKKLAGKNIVQGILKRTGDNAVRTSKKKVVKGLAGATVGLEANKLNQR